MLDMTWNLIRYDFQMMSVVYYDARYFFSSVGDELSYFHTWACFEIFGWHMLFFAFNLKFFFFAISPPDIQFFREFFLSFFLLPSKMSWGQGKVIHYGHNLCVSEKKSKNAILEFLVPKISDLVGTEQQ